MSVALSSISDTFALELGDEDDIPTIPPIFGRVHELSMLMQAYNQVRLSSRRHTVCLHGCSGSGKTALVESFRASLCETNQSYFCAGKYFQNSCMQEPFSAIMAAFSDLCDLVSQADDFDDARKEKIRIELGPDGNLLKQNISNLTPFLEKATTFEAGLERDHRSDTVAANKFKVACKTFLRVMASIGRPIVVFLDDIQWMDEGSRNLIESYLSDSELLNVLFILAYRDEDKESVIQTLNKLQTYPIIDLPLKNLNAMEVENLVASTMNLTISTSIKPLAEVVTARTNGNPLHVLEFMESIVREDLLSFDPEVELWVYDIDEIQRSMMICDTLADLLLRKIEVLPKEEQDALKIASLLGYEFDIDILTALVIAVREEETPPSSTRLVPISICKALEFGLVEKSRDKFLFSHDKLQTAFQDMFSEGEKRRMHKVVGKTLLVYRVGEGLVYQAAVHLNAAFDQNESLDYRLMLARINVDASRYCIDKSAFSEAALLLRWGWELIDDSIWWTIDFDLAFTLTEMLAKMELTIGNLNACKGLTRQTLLRARSVDMKINSLLIDVECHMAGNEMAASIESACSALADLGIRMPRKVSAWHVITKLLRVRRMLHHKKNEDILLLPLVQDRAIAVSAKILINLAWYCMLQDEVMIGTYAALSVAEMTLHHGLSSYSASALIVYAIAELNLYNTAKAERFGNLGIQLMNQLKHPETECMAICSWVSAVAHWRCPIKDLQQPIHQAIESGFATGDPLYTAIAIANDFALALCVGDDMGQLESSMRATYNRLCDLSEKAMLLWAQCPFQFVLNYRTTESMDWRALTNLTGEIMNEGEYIREVVKANHPTLIVVFCSYKANLCLNFGFIQQAAELYKSTKERAKIFKHNYGAMHQYLFGSISFYELYRETGQRKHLKTARSWQRGLRRIQTRGSPNVRFLTLLEAEDMAAMKARKIDDVTKAFDHAIAEMKETKNLPKEALASERAGFALANLGRPTDALRYFEYAMELYNCGAPAKLAWLHEKVESLNLIATDDAIEVCPFPEHISM